MARTEPGAWREISGSLVFRSKLRAPTADRLVRRPRLLELLETNSSKPLIIVVSPAGTGKTSLLATWVAAADRPIAWLSIDDTDHDATQLWTGIITSLEALVRGGLPRSMSVLQRPHSLDRAVATLLDELEEHDQLPSTLLLDDVHLVDDNPEAVASLALFIQHLPRWLQVVMITRRTPRLPLARLRARGQLAEVRFSDLVFTDDEAAELLRTLVPSLDGDIVRGMIDRTEGWAAAIQFAALTTRPDRALSPSSPTDRHDSLVSEYMWQEVLVTEPAELVDALLDVSLVARVNTSLAARLTGGPDAGRLLSVAESRGLFVSRLGSNDWFEIHSLVRDRLRAELAARSPAHLAELHARAAGWFEDAGEVAVALDHWIMADRPEEALRLLATKISALYDSGRESTIARVLARIPAAVAIDDLEAAVNLAWCYLLVDRGQFIRQVDRATALVRQLSDIDSRLRGRLTILHSIAATLCGDWSVGGQLAHRAVEEFGDRWQHDLLGRFAWNMIARDVALSERWRPSQETRSVESELSRDAERRLTFEGVHALGCALAGQPIDALRLAAGVQRAVSVAGMSILRVELAAAEAIAHRELGDHARALAELETLSVSSSGPVGYTRLLANLELTQLHLDRGHAPEAASAFTRAIDLVESELGGPGARNWLGRVGTVLALTTGDLEQARYWTATIDDSFWGPISSARIELATQDNETALACMETAVARCPRHDVIRDLLRARALAKHDRAVDLVGVVAERAAALGLVQTVASEGPECVELIELAAWRLPDSWLDHVRRAPSGGTDRFPARYSVEALTDREQEVLRLLPTRLTLREIADELFISMNTLKFHLKVIYRKLGCGSRAEAVAVARQSSRPQVSPQASAILRR